MFKVRGSETRDVLGHQDLVLGKNVGTGMQDILEGFWNRIKGLVGIWNFE